MPTSSDLVVCPPDRQLHVDYLHLKAVLAGELAQVADASARAQVQQLLLLLELITHVEYMEVSRAVKSAMAATKPMLSADEAAAMAGSCPSSLQAQEQLLLDSFVSLLLEGRYFPLSAQEWAVAQRQQFTFDIPVQIDWTVLDDQLLSRFWQRHQQDTAAAATHSSDTATSSSSSSSSGGRLSSELYSSATYSAGSSSSSSSSPFGGLLDRSQLPDFADRMLVFHRGVGVATAEGLYLDKKLDLLAEYLLVAPATAALARLRAAAGALLGRSTDAAEGTATATNTAVQQQQQQQQQQQAAVKLPSKMSTASWRNMSALPEPSAAAAGGSFDDEQPAAADGELRPFASADLAHQYARLVVRRSLRSHMPGPREVLAQLFTKLTLLEPTFRDVVVLYRALDQRVAGEAAASAAQAAESVMTAAVYASAGSATMAVDSLVEAARAAAEARSSTSSSSDDEYESRKQQQQQLPLQYGLEPSRVVGLNPSNVVVKSFADVALADLELVFPSKKAEVLPTTIVRSAITALGAVAAAVAWVQQAGAMQWSLPVVLPAAAVVAGRAVRALATVKSNQAALAGVMLAMQYDAARDSQEGVAVKLLDELREQHLKEVGTAYTVMLAQDAALREWQRQRRSARRRADDASGSAGSQPADASAAHADGGDGGDEPVWFSAGQIDAACEDFLLQRFGLKVDFMVDEALPRMVAWGLLLQQHQGGSQRYSLVPLPQAIANLNAYWQRMQQPAAAGGDDSGAAAHQQRYSMMAKPAAAGGHSAASSAGGRVQASAAGAAAGRMAVGCAPCWWRGGAAGPGGGGCALSSAGARPRRMPVQQVQRQRLVPCCVVRGARAAAAAAGAASVQRCTALAAAGRLRCWGVA
uniref:Uncharacterized protein n=1 Tax=Tetradesmus obliquus TaxID=3088 RepID=A0A383VX35_TETOB|eukprot:jgi/Sobl393_1/6903/SZX69324.1